MNATNANARRHLHEQLRLLLTAVQYFTRVPVPPWVGHSADLLGAARYFPAVGVFVGSTAAAALWLFAWLFPTVIAVVLSCTVTVVLTGALHEDGLADTFDGLGGAAQPERALEIMKDSRLGTFGVLALVLTLLLKVATLTALTPAHAIAALVAGHALSRWCVLLLMWRLPYVRLDDSTRAKPMVEYITGADVLIAMPFGLAPLASCGTRASLGLIAALLVLGYLATWYRRRIGGYTGDTLGAAQQLTELTFYLALLGNAGTATAWLASHASA